MEKPKPPKGYLHSFTYAAHGIAHFITHEHNAKSHVITTILVIVLGIYVDLTRTEWIIVLLSCGLMLCAEAFNTAIERVVDISSPSYHELAKQAKDVAAGAVLILAIFEAIIGGIIFIPHIISVVTSW
ncbi:MAG TPA: diacylglycerol kinase family protein [Bacteroidaceae bacterium]|nr:diacylglycerol kinase family protein [Bacteroidaceae bacterium]